MLERPKIEYLYKYVSLLERKAKFVKDIFVHNEAYFSQPNRDFNDPFDCHPRFSLETTRDKWKEFLMSDERKNNIPMNREEQRRRAKELVKTLPKDNPNIMQGFEEIKKKINEKTGVYCLTERYDSLLMWGHYADSHRGICIRFNASKEESLINLSKPVHYEKSYPVIKYFYDEIEEQVEKVFFTKSKEWEYEKEWRIALYGKPPRVEKYEDGSISAVILGVNISEQDKGSVLSWANMRQKPDFYQANMDKNEFKLEFTPIGKVNNPPLI